MFGIVCMFNICVVVVLPDGVVYSSFSLSCHVLICIVRVWCGCAIVCLMFNVSRVCVCVCLYCRVLLCVFECVCVLFELFYVVV